MSNKILLSIFLLLIAATAFAGISGKAGLPFANMSSIGGVPKANVSAMAGQDLPSGGTPTSLTCATADFCENFEDAITTCGSAPCWTVTDADTGLNSLDNTAEKNGTYGLSMDWNGATAGADTPYLRLTLAAEQTAMVTGFWYYAPTTTDTSTITALWSTGDNNDNPRNLRVLTQQAAGNMMFYMSGTGDSSQIDGGAGPGNWWWVTVDYALNATCTLKVYNSAGTLLGTVTATANNNTGAGYIYVFIHGNSVFAADEDVKSFWDTFILDWTDLTYPITPQTE